MKIKQGFIDILEGYDLDMMDNHSGVIYAMDKEFILFYYNNAWNTFAKYNNGIIGLKTNLDLGANIMHTIPQELQSFFIYLYNRCRREHHALGFNYQCSSPEKFRSYYQIVYPLKSESLLCVNSLRVEQDHEIKGNISHSPNITEYTHNSTMEQCGHCRRTKNMLHPNQWDWVPYYISHPLPSIKHTLCDSCSGYFSQLIPDIINRFRLDNK
jgi:hypothetical protein